MSSSPPAPSAGLPLTPAHQPSSASSSSNGYINATTILLTLTLLTLSLPFLLPASRSRPLLAWLDRKRYQYEVTSSLYMLTSTEKFIFSTCPSFSFFLSFFLFLV
jgi:hypothetical protein